MSGDVPSEERARGGSRPGGTAVQTVVFDFGGVLIDWDPRHLYRRLLPEGEVEDFLTEIGFGEWNLVQDSTSRSWADAVAELSARHPDRRELIEAYPARFTETMAGPIEGTVTVLRELHARGTRLLGLTNWSGETFHYAHELFDFLDVFDGIVVSGEEELAKPDPRIFHVIRDRYGLVPDETLFIDDSPTNVEAAEKEGLLALLFTDPDQLRRDLVSLSLL